MLTKDGTIPQQKALLFLTLFLILVTVWQLSTNSYLIHSTCTFEENKSQGHKGHDAVIPKGEDAIIPKGHDAIIPKGEDAIIPKGEDAIIPKVHDAIILVMGEVKYFMHWYEKLEPIEGIHIEYVFASWDAPVEIPDLVGSLSTDTIFIPDTAWEEGRNALALKAAEKEVERRKKYDFWIMFDDDVVLECSQIDPGSEYANLTTAEASCWQRFFDFVSSDYVMGPNKVSSFSVNQVYWRERNDPKIGATSFADANAYGFKRESVPYFLPYMFVRPGFKSWLAQVGLFCVTHHCLQHSVLLLPHLALKNPAHRDKTDDMTPEQISLFFADNLYLPQHNFSMCQPDDPVARTIHRMQSFDIIRADTPNELWEMIPEPNLAKCEALKLEYWDKFVAHLNYEGVK